jgi:hypothetical protein
LLDACIGEWKNERTVSVTIVVVVVVVSIIPVIAIITVVVVVVTSAELGNAGFACGDQGVGVLGAAHAFEFGAVVV